MDIGSLTGQIAIEDQLSGALTSIAGKVAQFAEGFDGALGVVGIGVTAAVAAIGGMAVAVSALGSRGADVNDLKETIDEFTGSVEASARVMDGLRSGTRNTVDDFDLMKFSARTLQAGVKLTADQFEELGQAAFVMANRGLGSITENLGSLSQALITGRTRGLAMKLGVIETKDATEDYAKSLGKTKSELNDYENAEAKRFAVMQLVNTVTKSNAGIQDDFNDRIAQSTVMVKNFLDELASAVDNSPIVAGAMDGIGQAIIMAFGGNSQTAIETVVAGINHFAILMVDAGIAATAGARVIHTAFSLVETIALGLGTVFSGLVTGIVVMGSEFEGLIAKLKPWDQEAQEAARTGRELADSWKATTAAMAKQTEEAAKGVSQQSAFDKKLDEVGGSLFVTRDRLLALNRAQVDGVKSTGMMNDAVAEFHRRQVAAAGAAEQMSKAQVKLNQEYRAFKNDVGIREMEDYAAAQKAASEQVSANILLEFEMNKFYIANAKALGDYTNRSVLFERQWVSIGQLMPDVTRSITDSGRALKTSFGDKLYQSFGDIGSILDAIPGKFAEIGAVAARTGRAIMDNLASGNWVGALVAGVTGVATAFGKLFGRGEKGKVDDMRQALIDASGGWDAFNRSAYDAGTTLTAVLNAKTVEDYKAAVDDLNAAIQFQDDAMKILDETVKKYGFSIEELGPKFSQQKLDEQAGTLLQDYEVLTAAAIDHNAILDKMAPSMYDYIQSVIAAGGTIPQQLRGPIEAMDKMGLLVDEAGENMVDVSKLTFAETLDQKFSSLIDTIGKLTDAISRGLGLAISNIPQPQPIHVPIQWDIPRLDLPSGGGEERHYATGGEPRSVDTIQAWVAPGERVLNPTENREYEAGGSGEVTRLLREVARYQADMPRTTARLVREAVQNVRVR